MRIKYPKDDDEFANELSRRVKRYLSAEGRTRFANREMRRKTFIQLALALGSYGLILSNRFHGLDLFVLQLVHGFSLFLVSIGVGHDGTHDAYSPSRAVNRWIGRAMDVVGVDTNVWRLNHLDSHHSAPNVPLYDSAIDSFAFFRFHPRSPRKSFMRHQHRYILAIYASSTLFKWFFYDFFSAFRSRIGNQAEVRRIMNPRRIASLFIKKFLVFGYALALPICVVSVPFYQYVFGFVCYHIVIGVALGLIFQVTHLSERTSFFEPDEKGYVKLPFAQHVLATTSDFCIESKWVTWLSGGLNLHVAHHLFPRVCQIHLPALTQIVKQTAEEFGHDYKHYSTMGEAFRSHLNLLRRLGSEDEFSQGSPPEPSGAPQAVLLSFPMNGDFDAVVMHASRFHRCRLLLPDRPSR